jgi:hypothetical protein
MGYTLTTLPIRYAKKALIDATTLINIQSFAATTTYAVIYKQWLDLTDAEYMWYSVYDASGNDAVLKIDFGATNILEDTISSTSCESKQTDISSYTGENEVTISLKTVGDNKRIDNISVWFRGS